MSQKPIDNLQPQRSSVLYVKVTSTRFIYSQEKNKCLCDRYRGRYSYNCWQIHKNATCCFNTLWSIEPIISEAINHWSLKDLFPAPSVALFWWCNRWPQKVFLSFLWFSPCDLHLGLKTPKRKFLDTTRGSSSLHCAVCIMLLKSSCQHILLFNHRVQQQWTHTLSGALHTPVLPVMHTQWAWWGQTKEKMLLSNTAQRSEPPSLASASPDGTTLLSVGRGVIEWCRSLNPHYSPFWFPLNSFLDI